MPKLSREQVESYYYSLYLLLLEDPRMSFNKVAESLGINVHTAIKLCRWAQSEWVLLPLFLRSKSHPNREEYVYFLKFRDAYPIFEKLKEDERVVYEAICSGVFDLMVISSEKIDFSMERGFEHFILSGPRSDFIFNKVTKRSFEEFFDEFRHFLEKGDFVDSTMTTPPREELKWDDVDLSLFKLLKHDARMKYVDILRSLNLSKNAFYSHLHNVIDDCTIGVPYFPRGYYNYDGYFILFRTSHQNQLIEQLGRIPVHCPALKVGAWVYVYIMLESDFPGLTLFETLGLMQSTGFIEEYRYSVPVLHWPKPRIIQEDPRRSRRHRRHTEWGE